MIIDATKTTDADATGQHVQELTEVELKLAIGGQTKDFHIVKVVDAASAKLFG